ncbi:MAG TPA: sigma-70 family RNA polymerase sigma factor [Polyangiales bacterium]|nr:sigma-70 family RNA polymerase sigma factor [Polyangiales bacterium]
MLDPATRAAAISVIELRDIDPDSDTDTDAFDALYVRYAPYVTAIGARLLGQCEEVEDLVQDVFVEVLRGLGQLREPAAFKGWLAQIAIRGATRRLRKRKLRWAFMGARVPEQREFLSPHTATPEQRTLGVQLYKLLEALPAKSRVIWILRHIEGEPLYVIARRVSCSLSTVQRRLIDAQAIIESMFMRDFAT